MLKCLKGCGLKTELSGSSKQGTIREKRRSREAQAIDGLTFGRHRDLKE